MKSAIGQGMTRRDHADVSNQLVSEQTILSLSLSATHSFLPPFLCSMLTML